jgi:23S rRNA pseudouridine2605 synthase
LRGPGAGNAGGGEGGGRGRGSPDRGGYKGNTPRPDNHNRPRPTAPGEGGGRGSYGNTDGNSFDGDGINNDRLPSGINPERTMMDFKRQAFGGGGGGGGQGRGRSGGAGQGRGRSGSNSGGGGNGGQPDPMQTSFGYIGGDSLQRQRAAPSGGGRGGNRGGSGNNSNGGGNGGGGRGRTR